MVGSIRLSPPQSTLDIDRREMDAPPEPVFRLVGLSQALEALASVGWTPPPFQTALLANVALSLDSRMQHMQATGGAALRDAAADALANAGALAPRTLQVLRILADGADPREVYDEPSLPFTRAELPTPINQRPTVSGFVSAQLSALGRAIKRATGGPQVGTPEFEALLDHDTRSVSRPGNRITLLQGGPRSFALREQLIRDAEPKETVYLQTFVHRDDPTGEKISRQMIAHAQRGGRSRLLYDGRGSAESDPRFFTRIAEGGVNVISLGKHQRINSRMHTKHLIVGNRAWITGGMNIGDEYAGGFGGLWTDKKSGKQMPAWHDVDMLIEGPCVHDAIATFVKDWKSLGGELSPGECPSARAHETLVPAVGGDVTGRVVSHRPHDDGDANTLKLMQHAIRGARSHIKITTPYFIPPPELREALKEAAARGVKVEVLTSDRDNIDFKIAHEAMEFFCRDLIAAGVRVYEIGPLVHAKTMTIDGEYNLVGSANMNGRSHYRDNEVVVAFSSKAHAAELERDFDRLLASASEVYTEQLRLDPLRLRMIRFGASRLARNL